MSRATRTVMVVAVVSISYFLFKYLLTGALGAEYLSGQRRADFVGAAQKSCLAAQVGAKENKDLTVQELTNYCTCFSNGMAEEFTATEIQNRISQRLDSPEVKKRIDSRVEQCAKTIAR